MNSWLSSAYGMGDSHHFFDAVGYIVAWVFGIPTGESHALIAGNGYIRVTEGAGATHTSYVNDISPFPP